MTNAYDKLTHALEALRVLEEADLPAIRKHLSDSRENYFLSRILPTRSMHSFIVKRLREVARAAGKLADAYEGCPSRAGGEADE